LEQIFFISIFTEEATLVEVDLLTPVETGKLFFLMKVSNRFREFGIVLLIALYLKLGVPVAMLITVSPNESHMGDEGGHQSVA